MTCNPSSILTLLYALCLVVPKMSVAQPAISAATNVQVAAKPIMVSTLSVDTTQTSPWFEKLLIGNPRLSDRILTDRKALNVQIIYTQVDRGVNGMPVLKNFHFNLDSGKYFDPSSVVKLPLALLTLQAINELKTLGIGLQTTMLSQKGHSSQTAVYNDPGTPNGKPTIANYLKRMLIAGDADAFNRLYEFLGQQYINDQLKRKGYPSARIVNRLGLELTEDENRFTNPIKFYGPDNRMLYDQPGQYNNSKYPVYPDSLGESLYDGDKLIRKPKCFTGMNRMSLEDLHAVMISLVFPAKVTATHRFGITEEDRKFMLKYMSQLSSESIFPPYAADSVNYPAAADKYLFAGADQKNIPSGVRIFNVAGNSSGQLADIAYVVDFDNNIEFFLSAVIYINSDGAGGEAEYDDKAGISFLQQLGSILYDVELTRTKKTIPDLTEWKFVYDGR